MSGTQPSLSLVVIGRNEGARLARCLQSVKAIRGWDGEIELIYVDSGSTDGSCGIARSFGARVVELQSERPSAALGRNAGWRTARAPVVLFLDGDTVLDPDFPAHAAKTLADPRVAVVFGRRRELHPEASIYNRVLDLDWIAAPGPAQYCGGDALMRRAVLEETGGYDNELIAGEEPDLCRRMRGMGYQILHVDCPMTGHDLAMQRWRQYWRRAVRTGHAYAEVAERYAATPLPLWKAESRANIKRAAFWVLLWLGCATAAFLLRSVLPLMFAAALLALMALRTARRLAWKSPDRWTLFLYGLHSHVQQIPILVGQCSYWWGRRRGRRKRLIEYKESPV